MGGDFGVLGRLAGFLELFEQRHPGAGRMR